MAGEALGRGLGWYPAEFDQSAGEAGRRRGCHLKGVDRQCGGALHVQRADDPAGCGDRHAHLVDDEGCGRQVVPAGGDAADLGRLPAGERRPDHPGVDGHPVEDLPVAAHSLAAQPPAAFEVERGQGHSLRQQMLDHH